MEEETKKVLDHTLKDFNSKLVEMKIELIEIKSRPPPKATTKDSSIREKKRHTTSNLGESSVDSKDTTMRRKIVRRLKTYDGSDTCSVASGASKLSKVSRNSKIVRSKPNRHESSQSIVPANNGFLDPDLAAALKKLDKPYEI